MYLFNLSKMCVLPNVIDLAIFLQEFIFTTQQGDLSYLSGFDEHKEVDILSLPPTINQELNRHTHAFQSKMLNMFIHTCAHLHPVHISVQQVPCLENTCDEARGGRFVKACGWRGRGELV